MTKTTITHCLLGAKTGLHVSSVALGTGRLGSTPGGPLDEAAAKATLAAFFDAGGNFVDTSSAYQGGRAEEIVGSMIRGPRRDEIVVSTKFGRTPFAKPALATVGSHRKAMRAEVEGSLRRLGTDRVDLLFAHFDDGTTPVEEMMRGFDDLVRAGKVLYVGLSNFPAWRIASAATLAELRGWTPLAALQLQYNLLERAIDREHVPLAEGLGLAVMAWSPLAGGLLSGTSFGERGGDTLSSEGSVVRDERARVIVDAVAAVASEIGIEPAGVAVQWVAARGLFPVIGPRHADQLAKTLRMLDVRLDERRLQHLDAISARPRGYPYDLLAGQRTRLGFDDPTAGRVC